MPDKRYRVADSNSSGVSGDGGGLRAVAEGSREVDD
jgi:hypothetical protein